MKVAAQSPGWRYARQLTRQEWNELSIVKERGICALCRRSDQRLVYEHDHWVGKHAGRGMTCQSCNAGHMAGIDAGRFAIDAPTRWYLMNPWYLARQGKRLPYDPRIRISVDDLDPDDRRALDQISNDGVDGESIVNDLRPEFGHPLLRAALLHQDIRSILRLRLMNRAGRHAHDIAEIADRMSDFQEMHLSRVLADHSFDWDPDAAAVFRLAPVDPFADIAADAA